MNTTKINKLMNILLGLSGLAIVVGALFKLQHYPFGDFIFWSGIWSNFILSALEISRLKKIITKLDKVI